MNQTFTAFVEFDSATNLYVGTIPSLPGGHSQGATLDELHDNLREVIELILEEQAEQGNIVEVASFVGIQQITVER